MARAKSIPSQAEQSGRTGAGGELHQQPTVAGRAYDDQPGRSHCRQAEFAQGGSPRAQLAGRLCSAGKDHPL
jgi:hypothetical protein